MANTFNVKVVTPDGEVWGGEALSVILPAADGYLGVWPGHEPLVTAMDIGILMIKTPAEQVVTLVAVHGGFAQITGAEVIVLAESAEVAEQIDTLRATKAEERARERLSGKFGRAGDPYTCGGDFHGPRLAAPIGFAARSRNSTPSGAVYCPMQFLLTAPLSLAAGVADVAQSKPLWAWGLFLLFVLLMLALDLGVFHRKDHAVGFRESLTWSAVWLAIALLFNVLIYFWLGRQSGVEFLTGYLVEKSLAVDNIFVFAMIFTYFHVPPRYQHRVLFWGIIGALLMRAAFIFAGIALIERFHFMIWVFGAFLILTGIKMCLSHGKQFVPEKNPAVKLARRLFPITENYEGNRFFTRRDGRLWGTPLLLVLALVEFTDLIFAVDSIPAILAITRDPFIVFTSNVFAILGLRSLYFALAGVINMFHLLHYGLSAVLIFVGLKMMIIDVYKIPTPVSLVVVLLLMAAAIVASRLIKPKPRGLSHGSHADGTPADLDLEQVARHD
jgi:tellurite resistance protein TerC